MVHLGLSWYDFRGITHPLLLPSVGSQYRNRKPSLTSKVAPCMDDMIMASNGLICFQGEITSYHHQLHSMCKKMSIRLIQHTWLLDVLLKRFGVMEKKQLFPIAKALVCISCHPGYLSEFYLCLFRYYINAIC